MCYTYIYFLSILFLSEGSQNNELCYIFHYSICSVSLRKFLHIGYYNWKDKRVIWVEDFKDFFLFFYTKEKYKYKL